MKVAIAIILSLFVSAAVFAQSASGVAGISGVVRDPSGAVIPNAKVVISSAGHGVLRTIQTNDSGVFSAPALAPGPGFSVAVTASGFAPYEAKNLTLQVGQDVDLRVNLAVASASTVVEVGGTAPLVESTKTDVSGVVDSRSIQDLPINGRRVDTFVLLTPGVNNDGLYGLLSFRGVAGQNAFLVDGADTTEQYYNENAGRTRIAAQISQDAVQEFQVVSSNYSAEYGRAMGGIVNTVTKSGSNEFHGTGYLFFRNASFNARDPFSSFLPEEKRTQAGGSVSGPIKKNKLFYFFNSEVTRRNFPIASSLNTNAVDPTTQSWKNCGVATSGVPAATPAQCSAINALLPRFFAQIPRQLNQELYFGRLDYRASDRNTFSASFNFLHAISPNGIQSAASLTTGTAITSNGNDFATVRNGRLMWTTVPTSSFVNEFRFSFAGDRQADDFNQSLLGGGLGYLQVSVNGTKLGPADYLPRIQPAEKRFQFQDNATWVKGKHSIKFGADIANTDEYVFYLSNYWGSYTYQTVNAFALDYGSTSGTKYWQSYSQAFGKPDVNFTMRDFGFYLQDQWRASDRLTVNAGLRYEYSQLPQPKTCNPDYPLTCSIHSQPTNLAPRIGLAYRLNDKTVIQAGFGVFFARFTGGTISNLFTSGNGVAQQSISLSATQAPQLAAGPVFPNRLASAPTGGSVSAVNIQMLDPNLKTPYSEQGNIGIQRQLVKDLAINVSYIWSRGLQLYGIRDLNLPTTTVPYTYAIADATGAIQGYYPMQVLTGSRPDKRYGTVAYDENGVNSYYNGLAVELNRRFSHGFQAKASYTWSHEIDDGQSYGGSTNNLYLDRTTYWLNNGDYKGDKGSGTLDQRHRFALSWVWAPQFTSRNSGLFKYLVNNWQLSSITTLQSGRPYGTLQAYLNDKPVSGMFGYSMNGTGFSYRVPWMPVNSYYLPPSYKSDARVSKVLPFGERYKLYVNFEMFNIANTWQATGYTNSRMYEGTKGVLKPRADLYVPSGAYGSPDGTQARRMQVSARFTF